MRELHFPLDCLKYRITALLVFFYCAISAQFEIKIVDQENIPLTGVEVYSSNYSITAISDLEGLVQLNTDDLSIKVNIQYLGFETIQLSLKEIEALQNRVVMNPGETLIEEVLVIGRNELSKEAIPYQVRSITQEKIQSTNPQTSADALAQHGNLYVQKSQMGGGSPVIRGFEANKVLLVLDGVRMNNAIYRNGHLQNAITVDQAMLEKMEVIFGPNSLTYGSDALGGVVHFKSRLPKLNFTNKKASSIETNYLLRYSSANQEKTAHLDFNFGTRKFASLTSISFSDFGDLITGSQRNSKFPEFGKRTEYVETINNEDVVRQNENPNVQIGTGYSQFDVLQKLLYQPSDKIQLIGNIQYSTSSDVPRYDQLTEYRNGQLRFAEWYYGPQKRFLASVTLKMLEPKRLYDKAIVIASMQEIDEDRIERNFGMTNRTFQQEDVSIGSLTIDFSKALNERHEFYYGLNAQTDQVQSVSFEEDIVSGMVNNNVLTRYPSDGSRMTIYGIYGQYHFSTPNQLGHLNTGLRYSGTSLSFAYKANDPIQWPGSFIDGISSNNSSLIWSLGWTQNYESKWQWRALVSSAFRSPNIDDMAKIRVRRDEVTFPNADLVPEKSINAELTIGKTISQNNRPLFKISTTGFFTRINDAIVRGTVTQPNGSTLFIDGIDTFNIVANINAQKANIYGFSTSLSSQISERLQFEGSINYTQGRELNDSGTALPLAHIPPLYGSAALSYDPGPWNVKLQMRFNGAKPLDEYGGTTDNPDLATPIGALSWNTINLYGQYEFSKKMVFTLLVENIFDTHYRQFASGVSASGFNVGIGIRGTL